MARPRRTRLDQAVASAPARASSSSMSAQSRARSVSDCPISAAFLMAWYSTSPWMRPRCNAVRIRRQNRKRISESVGNPCAARSASSARASAGPSPADNLQAVVECHGQAPACAARHCRFHLRQHHQRVRVRIDLVGSREETVEAAAKKRPQPLIIARLARHCFTPGTSGCQYEVGLHESHLLGERLPHAERRNGLPHTRSDVARVGIPTC